MPQRERVTWAQLRVGIMVIVGLTILAVGIFFISGEGGFFTPRYTLKTYLSGAAGLREGAQVRLAGVAVGNVGKVLVSSDPEPKRAVEVVMTVPRSYQKDIRANSVASIKTAGVLGDSYLDISRGSPAQEEVPEGGELKSSEGAEINQVVENANDVIVNLRVLSAQLNAITGRIQEGKGSIGKLFYDETLYNHLNKTAVTLDRIVTGLDEGKGSLGKLISDETLYSSINSTVDRLNKMLDDMQNGPGSFAKFVYDPSVYNSVKHMVAQADALIDGVNKGQGTMGKLVTDSQLYDRANRTMDHFDQISARMANGEGTLGKFSTDPALYNNLSAGSASLRDFLKEFQKSPKKYLSIKLHIF